MDKNLFQERIRSLSSSFPYIESRTAEAFGKALTELDNWELYRINPIQFAADRGMNPDEIVNLFVCAARIGLFDLTWDLICPVCSGLLSTDQVISHLNRESFHCAYCHVDLPVILDDYIEITFTVNPEVYQININPYHDHDTFRQAFFSRNFKFPKVTIKTILQCHIEFFFVWPEKYETYEFELKPERMYRLISIKINSGVSLITDNSEASSGTQTVHIHGDSGKFSPEEVRLHPGQVKLYVHNAHSSPIDILIFEADYPLLHKLEKDYPPIIAPFLTGKMLLNNQAFRSLFKMQELATDLRISVRSLTMLFTDLKGSTKLYDTVGDMRAYRLIQNHFSLLEESARKYAGAIVKTMGDAIMASFSEPGNGVMAAVDMMKNICNMPEDENGKLGLKIGLHEGPALTVNNDGRLDYFGQTVNIAARVQGLAQAGEIWLSDSVFHGTNVNEPLQANGYTYEARSVKLKGVGHHAKVYMCKKNS
ncbi:DUF5939 domain-containing protein [Desulfococcaceae bacterium HSG9]|nr:DUF5939 domain-containing protein [Desulfococcaceae bacterium HSG9]